MKRSLSLSRLALIWAGIVVGCSFIATPAKFEAPGLTMPVALQVGHATFTSLAMIEAILVVIGIGLIIYQGAYKTLFWIPIIIYVIQWTIVMPPLNVQTSTVINGGTPTGPPWHIVYAVLELLKVIALFIIGMIGQRGVSSNSASESEATF